MPNMRYKTPFIRRSLNRRHCILLDQKPHFIHFRSIIMMANPIVNEDILDFEYEDDSNDNFTGAEDTELVLSNLTLVEKEGSSMENELEADSDPSMEGAHALNKTPGSSHQENDLTPQLDEYINKLVDRRVGLTEERSEARIKAAETEILVLREELLKDRAKLDTLEARAAEKNRKRKERKARKKNTISEPEPVPEKRQRTDSTQATVDDGPSQEELTAEADLVREIEFHNPGSLSDGNMTTVRVAERISRERQLLKHSARRMEAVAQQEISSILICGTTGGGPTKPGASLT